MKGKYKNWESLKKAVKKGIVVNWKNSNYIVQYWSYPNNDFMVHSQSNDYNTGLFRKSNNEPIYNLKEFYTIKNKTMKLKKGTKEAKLFMSKLRASRGSKKLSGTKKKPVYVNVLGQKVKVGTKLHSKLVAQKKHFDDLQKSEISGAGDYAKFEISTIKALSKLLKKPLKATQKAVYDNKNFLDLISSNFDQGKTPAQTAKILKDHMIPKKQIKPLDAFVNLLTKKGKGQSSGGSKANFPMKLPAMVTIGALKSDTLNQIADLNRRITKTEWFIKFNQDRLKENFHTKQDKIYFKRSIKLAKKHQTNYKKQITQLKKYI